MPISDELLDPVIESITLYMADEQFDKGSVKTLRGVIDGMCPEIKRNVGFRMTPAFRKNKDYFEPAIRRALRDNGKSTPSSDEGVYRSVRNVFDALGLLAKSNGKEIETERQRLRNSLRPARDFLRNLKPPTTSARTATG